MTALDRPLAVILVTNRRLTVTGYAASVHLPITQPAFR